MSQLEPLKEHAQGYPPDDFPWSEVSPYIGSPPSSPFHGFGPEEQIPGRLKIKTEMEGGEEVFLSINREKRTGRPRGTAMQTDTDLIIVEKTRGGSSSQPAGPSVSDSFPVTPKARLGGTGSRPLLYLIGKAPTKFRYAKLPTTGAVLGRFLDILDKANAKEAAATTRMELKAVWLHHFAARLVEGKELGIEENGDEKRKIIKQDRFIDEKIRSVWKNWSKLETESRRPNRRPFYFKNAEEDLQKVLKKPFDISKVAAETIIKESGIKDWREEIQHLRNQLSDDQVGCPGPADKKQEKRDVRKAEELLSEEQNLEKEAVEKAELAERKKNERIRARDEEDQDIDNNNDGDFVGGSQKKKRKIDIMGQIALTADRVNASYQARAMIAAAAVNALGGNIDETNISKTSGWRKAKEVRSERAAQIKKDFKCPEKVSVHWDGKGVITKGNQKSNRICVYISGVEENRPMKLLAVPETPNGTGLAEANIVTEQLTMWNISKEVVGMVFDTTSSNTGAELGACKFVEDWCKSPILWLACRHHCAELHMMRMVHTVTGNTKDPGVAMFRRLKRDWSGLKIDLDNLVTFDTNNLEKELQEVAKLVLAWATVQQERRTWPRDDYREMLELLIVTLGGTVIGFSFKMPGADHHARWMSKVIYNLKIRLLSNIFEISPEEKDQVDKITEFTVLFYIKYWLETPLPASSARLDLEFMAHMLQYRLTRPRIAFAVLQSCYRHMWYLTPQMIPIALADKKLEDTFKEQIAKALHSLPRITISSGKPVFPLLESGAQQTRMNLASLVTSDSWLVFQLLGLHGPHDWLQTPASLWHLFEEFRTLQKFSTNLSVCNDIAERGIHLMSDFIPHCESEDQRQALFQCVEFHRNLVSDCTKKSLKLC